MNEAIKNYLEQSERRLQALEDSLMSDPFAGKKQPEKDAKELEVDKFIQAMKEIGGGKPVKDIPGKKAAERAGISVDEENEFIRLMKEINK